MHARSTTLQLDPSRIDEAVRQLESEEIPRFKQIDGFKGMTVLADRDSGKVIGITFWESREKLDASEEAVRESRRRAMERGGGSGEPQIERYEVVLDVMD